MLRCGVGILSTAPRATRAPSFPIPPVAAFPDLRCQSCPTLSLSRSEVQALHGPSPLLFFLPRMTLPPPPSQPGSEWIPLGPSFLPPSLARARIAIIEDSPRPTDLAPIVAFCPLLHPALPAPCPRLPLRRQIGVASGHAFRTKWLSNCDNFRRVFLGIVCRRADGRTRRPPDRAGEGGEVAKPTATEWGGACPVLHADDTRGLVHAQVGAGRGRGMTNNVIQRLHCSPTHALSQNYAFVSPKQLSNQRCRQSIHLSIRFQTSENEDGWLQRRLGFVPSCFVSLVSSRKPPPMPRPESIRLDGWQRR